MQAPRARATGVLVQRVAQALRAAETDVDIGGCDVLRVGQFRELAVAVDGEAEKDQRGEQRGCAGAWYGGTGFSD